MGRKRKNLSEMSIANGKVWDGNELESSNSHKYKKDISLADYIQEINQMNKLDLDEHATSVYVMPRENRQSLIDQLIREFKNK